MTAIFVHLVHIANYTSLCAMELNVNEENTCQGQITISCPTKILRFPSITPKGTKNNNEL